MSNQTELEEFSVILAESIKEHFKKYALKLVMLAFMAILSFLIQIATLYYVYNINQNISQINNQSIVRQSK